ncbi:TonB-dependent receptor [Piscinibacter gummiphilus]|uniref:TonB-dependent receptor n=1 Tax=Piscinibacter gummiphilus TaxID=946333 RepID=A0ABZ0D1H8_9BURK|nr:TonB-dependent receptor [Piscinibacter gummiphilus]WOB08923.1 TonB-dependent receptor [Piscinibacter gummiphilus]
MNKPSLATLAVAAAWSSLAAAQAQLDRVTIVGGRPATLPLEIPTTTESIDAAQIARSINATDSEDALKYFPSLNVRKRYIGDHDHAVLASRASGTGNSARSLVYADGILLSNLLGNGATFTPRWGLVTPEEIDRVDVLYGPFSAAYPGNSVGAVVDYVTRMPRAFEAHVKLQGYSQRYKQYATHDRFGGQSGSAALGSGEGGLSWWFNVSRLDSEGQPITFANRRVAQGTVGNSGVPVTGAVADRNPSVQDWWILGDGGRSHTVQDHAKLKLAYDITPTLRASYTLGYWRNDTEREGRSYLRDAGGNVVTTGTVNIDGRDYVLVPGDFASSKARLDHVAQGLSLKSQTRAEWDWEAAASVYDYRRDDVHNSATGLTDMQGTGWNTLALKGIWRPVGTMHTVEAGVQRDAFKLRSQATSGRSWLQSLWMQDAWHLSPDWRAVFGARVEQWEARSPVATQAERRENWFSPKLAISHALDEAWLLKASLGRAVRAPTVVELYQTASAGTQGDPSLRPETSWTGELTAERSLGMGLLRTTFFAERTEDALYAQTDVTVVPFVTRVQNVDAIRTRGLELALQWPQAIVRGLDLNASLTFADSRIVRNDKFPASVGHWQPRVPRWRATGLASYKVDDHWSASLGLRYSGKQYGTLDNSDPNGRTYTGVSSFLVADVRVVYRFDRQWSAAFGIDNFNNERYWAFHPYTQRTFNAELKFDL